MYPENLQQHKESSGVITKYNFANKKGCNSNLKKDSSNICVNLIIIIVSTILCST